MKIFSDPETERSNKPIQLKMLIRRAKVEPVQNLDLLICCIDFYLLIAENLKKNDFLVIGKP